ncbi:thiopeptide-type bacteriocin biosynthesis protein [Streptomyces sp. 12297]
MPPRRLTPHPDPDTTGKAVLDVLSGISATAAARRHGLEPAHLTDATALFVQAGHDALQHAATTWWQVYLHYPDWATAQTTFTTHVLPALHAAQTVGAADGWWYTRKHPCWRLRIALHPDHPATQELRNALDRLAAHGHLTRWWTGIYESETAAFGGPASMSAAHALFVADSHEIHHPTRPALPIGRRELSVLLCTTLMRAAGLEWYEQGDVWNGVITEEHRTAISGMPENQLNAHAEDIRQLLLADCEPDGVLFQTDGPLAASAPWAAAFRETGHALAEAVQRGTLDRGLRRVLSLHVIFHWNRLGLSVSTQSALAWAARTAILDRPQ